MAAPATDMTLPLLETPRLSLRPITEHDAEGLHEAYGEIRCRLG